MTTVLEQALEHLLNKEEAKASDLLHDYYVGIGRKVYEDIMSDDTNLEEEIADIDAAVDEVEADLTEEGDDELDLDSEIDPDIDAEEPVEEEQIVEYAEKAPTPVSTEEGSVNTASQKNGNNKPSTSAKAVISSGEEKGGATPKYTTQTDAADPKGSTMSKA